MVISVHTERCKSVELYLKKIHIQASGTQLCLAKRRLLKVMQVVGAKYQIVGTDNTAITVILPEADRLQNACCDSHPAL